MKSHENDLLRLADCVYKDATAKCSDDSLQHRDLLTIKSRVEHEGLSFLTITLPTFGKDFDHSLAEGKIDSTFFRSFKKNGPIPAFLQGMTNRVFDGEGRLLNEPCIAAIEGIRQIAYLFKKLQVPCSPERVARALTEFRQTEQIFESSIAPNSQQEFLAVVRALWNGILYHNCASTYECRPRHGPGATAERLNGNTKYLSTAWHDRLEPYFPLLDYAFVNSNARESEEFEKMAIVREDDEQPVRVIPVPKTLKSPRIIAIEPVCMQYTQQAVSSMLTGILESHPITAGHINFTDQSINRSLAIVSSKTGEYATIDLSSASDRVPCELALHMFDSVPDLRDAIFACRSKNAQLPNGDIIPLKKFASMGSALCFPVEAMYFYTLCIKALLDASELPYTSKAIEKVAKDVYVYGDDIIVPTDKSEIVIRTLQEYYCKVNVRKSFYKGNFRESCGMDAYDGDEVTPIYVRNLPPDNKRSSTEIVSWVATSNLFFRKGYWRTAQFLENRVERVTGMILPVVQGNSGGLGKINPFSPLVSIQRWSRPYQRFEVKTLIPSAVKQKDRLDGWPALLKSLLFLEGSKNDFLNPIKREDNLECTVRRGAVALKPRWISAL